MDRSDVRGKKFSVIGGARSGIAVARLLSDNGAKVFLSDSAPPDRMSDAASELREMGIEAEFGRNSDKILAADAVVLSPGVPDTIPVVKQAVERSLPLYSELEVASWFCAAPIVAVTGTNGKTTTTTLIGKMFGDAKRPSVTGGNIGIPFSQVVSGLDADGTAVLEVSSFQLDHIDTFRPRVSVILNITPDHLDRYDDDFERYVESKCRIFVNQGENDTVVYNHDDSVTRESVERNVHAGVRRLAFSVDHRPERGAFLSGGVMSIRLADRVESVIPAEEVGIRGIHNLQNAMAATLASAAMGIPVSSMNATLRSFTGVEHRLEFVRERDGVAYVNDSKATNVDSVRYALQSFSGPIILLLGGRDKGNDYTQLHQLVRKNVREIVAIGESAGKVMAAFSGLVPVRTASSMKEAVDLAAAASAKGDTVLLSPACASFDWFRNYEHRGEVFKEEVRKL